MNQETENILQSCNVAREAINKQIAKTFTGIPIKIDDSLDGMRYEMHVSRGLYEQIERDS